ncbi:putative transposase [Mycobacterium kansasii]|uniref:Putative transposase n=1 Tax=Mycobacterium kansasii TaxID=1768 RepID=A0A1V3X7F8_MYCKA|nr:putative transposase [Mycobacterium kansasii]
MWWMPPRGSTGPHERHSIGQEISGQILGPASDNHHHWKLLTPNRKRTAVTALRERFGVSERRACTVVGLHRSTMRLTPPIITTEEAELRAWLRRFSTDRPRWGGGGQPRWPVEPAGRSTTSGSAGCGARRACGSRSAARRSGLTGIGVEVGRCRRFART